MLRLEISLALGQLTALYARVMIELADWILRVQFLLLFE